jgi:hypothetical protein
MALVSPNPEPEQGVKNEQFDENQQSVDLDCSGTFLLIVGVLMVHRRQRNRPVRSNLGAIDLVLRRIDALWKERQMNEVFLFIFGLFVTVLAVGPLAIAGISENQSKKK